MKYLEEQTKIINYILVIFSLLIGFMAGLTAGVLVIEKYISYEQIYPGLIGFGIGVFPYLILKKTKTNI